LGKPAARFHHTLRYRSSSVGKQGVQVVGGEQEADGLDSLGVGAVENEVAPKPIHPKELKAGILKIKPKAQKARAGIYTNLPA
jgi:hypothetical protein